MKTSHIPVGCQGEPQTGRLSAALLPAAVSTEPSSPGQGCSRQSRQINIAGAQASLSTLKSGMELIQKVKGKKKGQECFRSILSSERKLGENLSLHTNHLELVQAERTNKSHVPFCSSSRLHCKLLTQHRKSQTGPAPHWCSHLIDVIHL